MAEKTIRVVLYGPDRQLWSGGSTKLRVLGIDSAGPKRLWLSPPGAPKKSVLEVSGPRHDLVLDLLFDAGQLYLIWFAAPWHRHAFALLNRGSFLRLSNGERREMDDLIVRLMLVPKRARPQRLNEAYSELENQQSPLVAADTGLSGDTFSDLSDPEKMVFLNIEAKLRATRIQSRPLISAIAGVRRAAPDRLFVMMTPEVKELVKSSADCRFSQAWDRAFAEPFPPALT